MRRKLLFLTLLFFLAFVSGCVSPERLFNLTPLGSSVSRNTVNLWPLYYANEKGTSAVWPVFDKDANGFALRPLIFNEGKEWGIFWPISDFDEDYFRLLNMVVSDHKGGIVPLFWINPNDSFYQILLAYKTDKSCGIFPLSHKSGDFSYFFPLYCHKGGKFLLTPVSYFSSSFNYFTLAWWNRDNGHWGLFPICRVGREGHRFLLWWKTPNSTGLFPFYINIKDFTAAGPVWWDNDAWGVFPICRFGEESSYCLTWWKTQNSNGLFPLYFKFNALTAVGPAWWSKDSWGFFPLFLYSSKNQSRQINLLCHILGGYERYYGGNAANNTLHASKSYSLDWLCCLGKFETSLQNNNIIYQGFRMWPFFDYSHHVIKSNSVINRHRALCGALWRYSNISNRVWLGEHAEECKQLANLIKNANYYINDRNISPSDTDFAQKLEDYRRLINEICQKLGLEPLNQLTYESIDTLSDSLEHKYSPHSIPNRRFGMLLNLVDYKETDDSSTFSLLWGSLFKRKMSPMENETTVLWRGFRQVTTPNQSNCEIFPFISYYNNQKEQTTVSAFAWRLYRRETSPAGNKLWLFFIPFQ